jgi:hypothetical protein
MPEQQAGQEAGAAGQAAVVPAPETEAVARLLSSDVVNSSGFLVRTRCKVCNSPLRGEADAKYEGGMNCSDVKQWLEQNGLVVCVQSVRHHMREHYKSMERMLALSEYCDDLEAMMARRRAKQDRLEMIIAMSEIEIARIVSLETRGNLTREKDRNSMLMASAKSITDAIKVLNSMADSDAKAKAVQHKFIRVWRDMIENAPSEEIRRAYVAALDSFKKAMEDTD